MGTQGHPGPSCCLKVRHAKMIVMKTQFSLLVVVVLVSSQAVLPAQGPAGRVALPKEHRGRITALAMSGNGERVVSGSADGTVNVWDVASGRVVRSLRPLYGQAMGIELSNDARWLVAGQVHGRGLLRDLRNDRSFHLAPFESTGSSGGVAMTPDGRLCALAAGREVATIDVATRKVLRRFRGPRGARFHDLALSADGAHLAAASDERVGYVWSTRDGSLIARLSGHGAAVKSVRFLPDGRRIVTRDDLGVVAVWLWREARVSQSFGLRPGQPIVASALSEDGKTLAYVDHPTLVTLAKLDKEEMSVPMVSTGREPAVAVALNARLKLLVTGHASGAVRFTPAPSVNGAR